MFILTIDHELIPLALQRADGTTFENFANAFFSALIGQQFVPLGGMHDGGADGYIDGIAEGKNGVFLQSSIRPDFTTKIRQCLTALSKSGRTPSQLFYASSQNIPLIDKEEASLFETHRLPIRLRDQNYFRFHINDSDGTISAFHTYLRPLLRFLEEFGAASFISNTPGLPTRALCVFLGQEVERRRGSTDLLEAVVDSLILWALRDTDPDKGKLMTRDEVLSKIVEALPSAKQFVKGVLDNRLNALTAKSNTNGREVRHYRKQSNYCLPYETRIVVQAENAEDELLKTRVKDVFLRRLQEFSQKAGTEIVLETAAEICFRTVELSFQKQGIEVSYFMSGKEPEQPIQRTISEHLDDAIEERQIVGDAAEKIKEACFYTLRAAFYHSEEVERRYFSKLCRTFCLLFTLQNHPEIVEYFRGMSKRLYLYVGSDLLVRALSECFLKKEDAMTRNMFALLKSAGANLILTERCLEELATHLIACDQEFRNHYSRVERLMNFQLARQISEILIRTYFYGKLEAKERGEDRSWPNFIGQWLGYSDLYVARGRESLKNYLCEAFGLEFEDEASSRGRVDWGAVEELKTALLKARHWKTDNAEVLAENDAYQAMLVYAKREELKEGAKANPYGYRTWWLTQESAVRSAAQKLIAKRGSSFIMRPEFLLNYIALSPSTEDVRRSYDTVFPSLLGVQLSNRMKEGVFKEFIHQVDEAQKVDEHRARVLVGEYSDRLKSDQFKRYPVQFPDLKRKDAWR